MIGVYEWVTIGISFLAWVAVIPHEEKRKIPHARTMVIPHKESALFLETIVILHANANYNLRPGDWIN